jgi:hypothetical protein
VWGHEYVITSLLKISVSKNKTRRPPPAGGTLDRTSFAATRSVCLEGALARPCTILVVTGPAPKFYCHASRQHDPGQGRRLQRNPLHFSGEIKDFFARQIKDKTGSAATRKKALDHEKLKTDT